MWPGLHVKSRELPCTSISHSTALSTTLPEQLYTGSSYLCVFPTGSKNLRVKDRGRVWHTSQHLIHGECPISVYFKTIYEQIHKYWKQYQQQHTKHWKPKTGLPGWMLVIPKHSLIVFFSLCSSQMREHSFKLRKEGRKSTRLLGKRNRRPVLSTDCVRPNVNSSALTLWARLCLCWSSYDEKI